MIWDEMLGLCHTRCRAYYLESVYKCTFPVMPDLIRHPDVVPTKVGNQFKDWIPAGVYLDKNRGRNDDLFADR